MVLGAARALHPPVPLRLPSASHWDPTASAVASQCLGKEAWAEKPHFAPQFLLVSHSGSPTPAPTSSILCSPALSSKHPLGNNNITPIAESYDRTALPRTFTHFTLYSTHNHPATQTVALFTGEEAQSAIKWLSWDLNHTCLTLKGQLPLQICLHLPQPLPGWAP